MITKRSKERVKSLGEVFTPPNIVSEMVALIPDDKWKDFSFIVLEPTCGNGNFLKEIVKKKMDCGLTFLQALNTTFGTDICSENIDEARHMLLFLKNVKMKNRRVAACIIHHNIFVVSDFLKTTSTIQDKPFFVKTKGISGPFLDKNSKEIIKNRIENIKIDNNFNFTEILGDNSVPNDPIEQKFLETKVKDMPRFDLVIGNPPYQKDSGGFGAQATPLYNLFVEKIIDEINPKYFSFIIESRWFAGGMGLKSFRKKMLADKCLKLINHFPTSKDIFPSIPVIEGGVCYFLRDKDYKGICTFNGWKNDFSKYDVIIKEEQILNILNKVVTSTDFMSIQNKVFPLNPFSLPTNFNNFSVNATETKCYVKRRFLHNITNDKFEDRHNILKKWKVLLGKADGSAFVGQKWKGVSNIFIAKPNEICTMTYVVVNVFDSEIEAKNFINYMRTKLFNLMLSTYTITQDLNKNKFPFVPDQLDYTKEYTDEELYKKYGLTKEEIEFIESKFK